MANRPSWFQDWLKGILQQTPLAPFTLAGPGTAVAGAAAGPALAQTGVLHDVGEGLTAIKDAGTFFVWLTDPRHILRVAEVMAGGVLVLVGLLIVAHHTEAGRRLESTGTSAAKVAALA